MTSEEVLAKIQTIREKRYDDEMAHAYEDDLYREVLEAIAKGAENAKMLASLALTTKDIEFARWCA